VALYGKDDVPSNLEIISLVLLGSFLTVSLFLAASTFYYRRKARAYHESFRKTNILQENPLKLHRNSLFRRLGGQLMRLSTN
jgi:hypothetical protein